MKNHPGAYRSVAAGCFVLIVLGGIYAFSTYVPTLISQWGFSPFQTQTTFGLTIFLFTLMMIPGGRKLPHWGPRRLILLAGALFMGSHFLASLAAGGFPLFLLSYLLLSCAMGLGYVSVVSCGVLWFPHRKGLVTGLTIGGYGLGGVLLTAFVEQLFSRAWPLASVLRFVGLGGGLLILLCGLLTSTPPGLQGRLVQRGGVVKAHLGEFVGVTFLFFFGTLPGLMFIGVLKPFGISVGLAPELAAVGVAALSVGNASGRISWGFIADRFHTHPLRVGMGAFLGVLFSVVLLYGATFQKGLYFPAGFFLGFFFGAPLVISPHQLSSVYGLDKLSAVYPLSASFHGFAASLGAPIAGLIIARTGLYTPILLLGALGVLLGSLAYFLLLRKSSHL